MLKWQNICSICKENNLDSPEVLRMLISKVSGYVRGIWNIRLLCIRRTQKKDPRLFGSLRFLEEENMLVNEPLFSKEGVIFLQKQVQVVEDHKQDQVV